MAGILNDNTSRNQNDQALQVNTGLAEALGDMLASTLGSYGLDKMLVDSVGNNVITNDGATIMKMLDLSQPASKLIAQIAKTQDERCGDGTTSTVILAGAFMRGCRDLRFRWGIHQTLIAKGYSIAREICLETLKKLAIPCSTRDELIAIAGTSLNSKSAKCYEKSLVSIAVDSVTQIFRNGKADIKNIKIIKKLGLGVGDTELFSGVILPNNLESGVPKSLVNSSVVLLSGGLEYTGGKESGSTWRQQKEIIEGRRQSSVETVDSLVRIATMPLAGISIFCRGSIDPAIQSELTKRGIISVSSISIEDMKLLQVATGATPCSFQVLKEDFVGTADAVEERIIGDEPYLCVEKKGAGAMTVVIRGGAFQSVDEIERGFHDCLMVISDVFEDRLMLPGGGAAMVEMAKTLRDYTSNTKGIEECSGKERFAINAYADALEVIPLTLARNGGLDELDILLRLRNDHIDGKVLNGVDYIAKGTGNMINRGVVEPLRVVEQAIQSATEVSIQIIRVDDMLVARQLSETHKELEKNSLGK
jgi:chaperonin GroEL (HSP60 family)